MINLSGKKILFIGPEYYDYHTNIIQKLESFGANIDYYPEMINNFTQRAAKIIKREFRKWVQQRYLNVILKKIASQHYDIFFLIRGEIITPEFIEKIKNFSPDVYCVMYQWDSVTHNNYLSKLSYFDQISTFDKTDAQKYAINYLPLFYTDQYKNIAHLTLGATYDIVFYGAYHSDRLQIIKQIDKQAKEQNLNFYHHLYITKFSLFRGLLTGVIKKTDLPFLKTFTVPSSIIHNAYSQTKAVLDIEMKNQNGLTIRTLEVLGSNLKLITTNANIADEPFYDSKRIMIIDRKKIKLESSFFENNLVWDTEIEQYHIDNWLSNIFSKEAA